MSDKNKSVVQYSFNGPQFSLKQSVHAGGANFSVSSNPAPRPEQRPLIPPEIGPDPRNATAKVKLTPQPAFLDESSGIRYDFNHGFRVLMPLQEGKYTLFVYDADAEILLHKFDLKAGQMVVGDAKYYIRYRLMAERDGKLIFRHDYDCSGKNVMVVIPDGGLGDNLAWMPYAEAFRVEHHAKVTCVCGEWLIRLVKDQYPELEFIPVGTMPGSQGFYASYFCAIFPKERKSWRPSDHQNFGMQGSVAKLLGVEPVPHKIRFKLDAPRPFPEPYVCISTLATNPAKYWNFPDGWNILCRYLKRLGYRVLVMDRDKELFFAGKRYAVPEEAEDWTGLRPISERIAVLQHAEFFVGLPSGLSWLAWSCNTPAVMLSGFTLDGAEFPTPYRVTNFNFCHGCWNDSNLFFDMTVPVWCPRHLGTPREIECTRAITPKMVIDTVNRIPGCAKRLAGKTAQLPKVSFIITSFHGDFLPQTLASIERLIVKSAVPSEIILYDDASNSNAAENRLDQLLTEYPDILHVYRGAENVGAAEGRNEAIRHARGEYLLIFDDDDVILPFDLKKSLEYLDQHPDTPMSYAQKYLFSQEKGFLHEIHGAPHSLFEAFWSPKININAAIVRKSAALKIGGFQAVGGDKKILGEDVDFMIRLGLTGPLHFEREPRCLYRIHPQQLTAATPPWADEITQGPAKRNPDLYEKILNGDFPDMHGPNFRLVRGLMGAAFYFHQHDRKIFEPIMETAIREFPDDFGVWDVYFLILLNQRQIEKVVKLLPEVQEKFQNDVSVCYNLFCTLEMFFSRSKRPMPPEIRSFGQTVSQKYFELPPIVEEELKRIGAWKN